MATALAIVDAVRAGKTRSQAAKAAGVATSTFMAWLAAGRADGADQELRAFADAVGRADEDLQRRTWAEARLARAASLASPGQRT